MDRGGAADGKNRNGNGKNKNKFITYLSLFVPGSFVGTVLCFAIGFVTPPALLGRYICYDFSQPCQAFYVLIRIYCTDYSSM